MIYLRTIFTFEKTKLMSHDNHSNDHHENKSEHTYFDGGGVAAFGFLFVIFGLLIITWLMIAG